MSNENSFTEQDKTASTFITKKIEKPPPITIHNVENFKDLQEAIVKDRIADSEPTTTKTLGNGNIMIITHSDGEY